MGNVPLKKLVGKGKENKLTKFQRQKLKYDFDTFFDLNKDGHLSFNDLLWAKDKICFMSGWKIGSDKYKETETLFKSIWATLELLADIDKDGKITKAEWLIMWTAYKKEIIAQEKQGRKDFLKTFYNKNKLSSTGGVKQDVKPNGAANKANGIESPKSEASSKMSSIKGDPSLSIVYDSDEERPVILPPTNGNQKHQNKEKPIKKENSKSNEEQKIDIPDETKETKENEQGTDGTHQEVEESILPKWLTRYLQFRFDLLDRTGDGIIDNEEFEYVLSEFGCSERVARQAFTIVTKNKTVVLDFDYFVQLFEQFYLSDDPSDLGNFINGKLDYNDIHDEDSDEDPGLEDHKVDSNASLDSMDSDLKNKPKAQKDHGDTIRLHESCKKMIKEKCNDAMECCVIL